MKTIGLFLVAMLGLVRVAVGAPFEGRVIFLRAELGGAPHDIIYRVKGDRNRVEVMKDRVTTFLTDSKKAQTTVILEDDMAWLVLPALAPRPETPRLEKTDETAAVLGVPVRKYLVTGEEGTTELWLAEGFGKYTGFGEGFAPPPVHIPGVDVPEPPDPRDWEYALAGKPLMPFRVSTRDSFGREVFRIEVRSITSQTLDDRMFGPSSTYRKLENWPKSAP